MSPEVLDVVALLWTPPVVAICAVFVIAVWRVGR